jgi:hypothetical protein
MKASVLIGLLLLISLTGNGYQYIHTTVQSDSLFLIPTMREELKILSTLLPPGLNKSQIEETLSINDHNIEPSGEYYYAEKPNSTLSVNNMYFIFSLNGELVQINSASDSLEPIYEKP